MDDIASYNKERWEALAQARIAYSRPWLELTEESAREAVDPQGMIGDIAGKRVLCLAGGGGQQSAAFALLGADVTVLDITETQLERDREAVEHYGLTVTTCQGDMRDLSRFAQGSFDVVYHAHSLNFVPDPRLVFDQVQHVLRAVGPYRLSYSNPFVHGMFEARWLNGGYAVDLPYADGQEMVCDDPAWEFKDETGDVHRVDGPREWRHALSTVVNGLIERGFTILGIREDGEGDANAEPGSWEHFQAMFPPWLVIWARLAARDDGRSSRNRESLSFRGEAEESR